MMGAALPDPRLPWAIPPAAVALIAEAEGCRLRAYRCPAGVWTIGWGRITGVKPGMTCTQEQADDWLCREIAARVELVQQVLTAHAEPNQLGALVSLHYNIGDAAFRRSTVLRAHNAGDTQAAARAFALWNKARVDGVLQALPGLTARRAREAALYLTPEPDERPERMPQAVEPESKLTSSPIAQSGAVISGAGIVKAISQAGDQFGTVAAPLKQAREVVTGTLGVPEGWFLPLVLVAVGGLVLWQRAKQRRQGWA